MWVIVAAMKVGTVVLPIVAGPTVAYADRTACETAIAPIQERVGRLDAVLFCRQYSIKWTK